MCVKLSLGDLKLSLGDLNLDSYSLHPTSIYTCTNDGQWCKYIFSCIHYLCINYLYKRNLCGYFIKFIHETIYWKYLLLKKEVDWNMTFFLLLSYFVTLAKSKQAP